MKEEVLTPEWDLTATNTAQELPSEDEHIVKMWTPFNIKVDESFNFIPKNPVFRFFSFLLRAFALAVLSVMCRVMFGLKVEGRENLRKVQKKGYVTVCNHVNFLDCAMVAIATRRLDTTFTVLKSNFEIPLVRHIIKLLGAMPIPQSPRALAAFNDAVKTKLEQGHVVHFYPESVLNPYFNGVRKFKRGAFLTAVRNDVPVLPLVVTYKKGRGPLSSFKRKPLATIHILEPVYPDASAPEREEATRILTACREAMIRK